MVDIIRFNGKWADKCRIRYREKEKTCWDSQSCIKYEGKEWGKCRYDGNSPVRNCHEIAGEYCPKAF